jgi:hypothetical protein
MSLNPESFKGKLYLLAIDKIVIGAIIAVAFVAYDRYRTIEVQGLQDRAAQVQLAFERAKLAKEFLPFITNRKEDVIARGYVLREAARTGSIDADAAIEIGRQLLLDGISDDHFRRVMVAIMPDGMRTIARRGGEMASSWRKRNGSSFTPTALFNPVSGVEHIPAEDAAEVREARLWRAVLLEGLAGRPCDDLSDNSTLAAMLYGLFILAQPGSQPEAIELSQSPCRGVRIVGQVKRVLFSGNDPLAVERVAAELGHDRTSAANLRLARVILGLLLEFGPPSGPIAFPVAQILVEPRSPKDSQPGVAEAHYWLQWQSADVLDSMVQGAQLTREERLQSVRAAEPVLLLFMGKFTTALQTASDDSRIEALLSEYEGGKLVRRIVGLLKCSDSAEARASLSKLHSVGPTKLRPFPFLEEDLGRPLKE